MSLFSITARLLSFTVLGASAHATDLKITGADGVVHAQYSQSDAEALGTTEIRTTTPWTDGVVTLKGVDGALLLKDAGFEGRTVTAIALDDYAIIVEWKDFEDRQALIATQMDGVRLTSGNKGPFWIVFDYDNASIGELGDIRSKSVWHLVELELE